MKNLTKLAHSALVMVAFVLPSAARAQPRDAQSAARDLVNLLAKEDFAGAVAQFDANMQAALPEAKLREVWRSLLAQAGALQNTGPSRMEQEGGYDIVFVTCRFERATLETKVVCNAGRQVAGLFFQPAAPVVPPAVLPKGVIERAVTVGTGKWTLPGTLTMPESPDAAGRPAVVLVHGSGPGDRDETVGANKPFRDLAWGLAEKGLVVLRYEKRTKQYPAKVAALPGLTVKEEVIDDALAAAELLRQAEGVDARRIFVLGHSLGGMLAPRIARADPRLAGVIILAGASRPLEELMVEQMNYLFTLDGKMTPAKQATLDELTAQVARVKSLTPADATSSTLLFHAPASYWLDLRGYDATAVARGLPQRMLILQGGRDYQSTAADFAGWKRALGTSERVTLKLYPKLNHLFITGEGRSTPAEYDQPGHLAQAVIDDIAAWVLKLPAPP